MSEVSIAVIDTLREEPMSAPRLAATLQLSVSHATWVCRDLRDTGRITVVGSEPGNGTRPRSIYSASGAAAAQPSVGVAWLPEGFFRPIED
jgi:hypothetical protein